MQNLPTLRQMQYLVALDDHKNFQRAAEECAVTQSTLSGGLKDMEDILRAPVIDRSSRKLVRFTPLGEDILKEARKVIGQMESLTYRAQAQNQPLSWPLRMGIIPTIAPYLLPKILKPLQAALPKLELHIHEMRSPQLVEKLNDNSLDFALMAFPYDTKGLEQISVYEEHFVCAAPPKSFKGKKHVTMKDLEGEKLLLLEDGHCLRAHALDACKLQPLTEMKTLSAASLSTLIQLVHQGYGITLLPDMAVAGNPMLPKDLNILPFSLGAPSRKVGFAYRQESLRVKDIGLVTKTLTGLMAGPAQVKGKKRAD